MNNKINRVILPGVHYTWRAFRTNSITQKILEAWSSQWTCTEMHSTNDSIVVNWSGTIGQ